MKKVILFDLDGTLTESGEGIIKSVQYALRKMGQPESDIEKLKVFIGPPLHEQFIKYSGFNNEEAEKAVTAYRERYSTIGIFENKPYAGIEDMLEELKKRNYILAISSSKPETFVKQIVEYFNLTDYFTEIVGSTMNGERTDKSEVIKETLKRLGVDLEKNKIIMVGDKEHDVYGARSEGLDCIVVSYGYGTEKELKKAKPLEIVKTVVELQERLIQF